MATISPARVIELPLETYAGPVEPDWCPGCGDFGVLKAVKIAAGKAGVCLLYTSPSPRDLSTSRMPSSA